ncbi:hypothetical protein APHAL10511_001830 [Amanita phalloides]|nr:hypothetical protein APHAL10511_001830 [Amanita phalloides]
MFEMDMRRIPTLFGYTTLGEFSPARERASEILHHVEGELPVVMLLGTSVFIAVHRRSSKGFSIETQVLLLAAYLLRYAKDISLISWGILSESRWLQLDTIARLFRVIAAMITVFVTIRYSPHLKVSQVLQSTALYLVGAFSFAYAARRTGLLMDSFDAPSPIYISSLFLEAVHLLPQYKLFTGNKDEATRVATIISSVSFVAVTVVGIAAQYVTYTMFFINLFWERAVWTHGAKVAYLVVGTGCLISTLLSRPGQKLVEKF